jgi:hypothetical protein
MSPTDARRQPPPPSSASTKRQASVATTERRVPLVIRNSVTETDVPSRREAHAGVVSGTSRATRIDRVAEDLTPGRRRSCPRIRMLCSCLLTAAAVSCRPRPRDSGLLGWRMVTIPCCPHDFNGMSPTGSDDRPRPSTTGAHQVDDSGADPRCSSTMTAPLPIAPSYSAEHSTWSWSRHPRSRRVRKQR